MIHWVRTNSNRLTTIYSLIPTLTSAGQLAINSSTYYPNPIPNSSFELAKLIIFDQVLSYNEMKIVSDALTNYLAIGVLDLFFYIEGKIIF